MTSASCDAPWSVPLHWAPRCPPPLAPGLAGARPGSPARRSSLKECTQVGGRCCAVPPRRGIALRSFDAPSPRAPVSAARSSLVQQRLVRILVRMKTYPLAEAKAKLSGLIDEVSRRDERVTITKHGRPAAVLMSPNEVESIEATLEIMSDPEFYAEILRNSAALDRGEGVEMTLEEIFGEEVPAARDRAKARAAASGRRPAPPAAARSKTKSARVPARPPARRGRR